jgi:hypothetical protein
MLEGEEQRNFYGFVVGDVEIRGRAEMSSAAACREKRKGLDERRRRRCRRGIGK